MPKDLARPGLQQVFMNFDTMERPNAVDAAGQPVVFPIVAKLGLESRGVTWQPQHKLDANLENRVRLIGFDTPDKQPEPGQEWPLTLYWQVEGDLDKDYTVFVHVLGGNRIYADPRRWAAAAGLLPHIGLDGGRDLERHTYFGDSCRCCVGTIPGICRPVRSGYGAAAGSVRQHGPTCG